MLSTQSWPAGHCVHDAPHRAPVVLLLVAQVLSGQMWKPVLQEGTQEVPLQSTVPFVGAVQGVHVAPQAALVSLRMHVGVAVPAPCTQ
jgi:hypothetical protein